MINKKDNYSISNMSDTINLIIDKINLVSDNKIKKGRYSLSKVSDKLNEIIDEVNKLVPDPEPTPKGTEAGDIAYWDGTQIKFAKPDQWNDSLGIAVAVVVVPSSHNDNGKSTCISLANMSCVIPELGSLRRDAVEGDNYMCFGGYGYDIPGITNYDTIPVADPYSGTSTGTNGYASFPSDMWADSAIAEGAGATPVLSKDGVALYPIGYGEYFVPSPYNANGSKNTEYNVSNTVLSYTCGKELSAAIKAVTTKNTIIADDSDEGSYPANQCCLLYETAGTNPGDWYLPCMSELGYLSARFVKINNSLKMIDNAVEMGDYYGSDILGACIWPSNTYTEYDAWGYYSYVQYCDYNGKSNYGGSYRVRAFIQL